MPSAEYMKAVQTTEVEDTPETERSQTKARRAARVKGYFDSTGGAFVGQFLNDITAGGVDEAASYVDYYINRPLGMGEAPENLKTREEIRQYYEESIIKASEENPVQGWGGTIASFFVPVGWAAKAEKGLSVGRLAVAGGIYGGAAGALSSDPGERTEGALMGAGLGLGAGLFLGAAVVPLAKYGANKLGMFIERGRTPSLEFNPIVRATDEAASLTDNVVDEVTKPVKALADEPEPGSIISAKDLTAEPEGALAAISKRIGKLTADEAEAMLVRIEKAQADGAIFDDPHYRSLLNIDLTEGKVTPEDFMRAAEVLHEATEELAIKAGRVPQTMDKMTGELQDELKKGLTLDDLKGGYEETKKGYITVLKAQTAMYASLTKLVNIREELLPKLVSGEEGIRKQIADQVNELSAFYVYASGTLSNAGRNLGVLSKITTSVETELAERIRDLTPDQVQARINQAVKELNDEDLKQLLGKIKNTDDATNALKVLTDPEDAKAFTLWNRTINSVSLFLRSNPLTFATATFNVIGMVTSDLFRNHLTKQLAAGQLRKAGRMSEAVALQLEERASRAVYMQAHKEGMKALLGRVKWELWTDVEKVASVGWGSGRVAALAAKKRSTMLSSGYTPNAMREFDELPRLDVRDTAGFNQRLDEMRTEGGALANVVYHFERARAVTANTVDAVGGAAMKLFTASIDDWGKEFIKVKETYAAATRFAVREAQEAGVPIEQLEGFVKSRAQALAETPNAQIMKTVEDGLLNSPDGKLKGEAAYFYDVAKMIDKEADAVLAMDGPQGDIFKSVANTISKIDRIGFVMPYVRTPIRLFERGLVDYGPFGLVSKRIRDEIAKGGIEGALAKARVEAGTSLAVIGLGLGIGGGVTMTNGPMGNSAGLDAGPPNRLNLPGGGFIEISRFDPFSVTLAVGAIFGQAFREGFEDSQVYEWQEAWRGAVGTAIAGTWDSILDKSYLKGLSDFQQAIADTEKDAYGKFEQLLKNGATRLIPMSGVSRQVNESFRSSAIESVTWADELLRHIPGAGWGMAPRVDPLGDEIKGRTGGINFGNSELTEGETISPVKAQLRDLGIKINTLRKSDLEGFDLNADELSEVRKIRGKEAQNGEGLTMPEALGELFADPWFQALQTKEAKRKAVVDTMKEFNEDAWSILLERRPELAGKKQYYKSLQDYIAEGLSTKQAEQYAREDTIGEGLPAPQ